MIIGVAGTAKNTGKTTTLCALIDAAYVAGRLPGVTGIGYDGEERDNVTLLPKPRITVFPGMIVTTSEQCLDASTARLRILRHSGYQTALGEVVVTVVEEEGRVVVAGPNKAADLAAVAHQMTSLGVSDLLVDGSLNRIAPMAVADRIVFATGAARTTELQYLAGETGSIERIFRYGLSRGAHPAFSGIRLGAKDVTLQTSPGAIHGAREVATALERLPDGLDEIVVAGLITADGLGVICDRLEAAGGRGVSLVFDDPFRLLLAGDPVRIGTMLLWLDELGVRIAYRRTTHLAAFTFNPCYPAFDGTSYRSAYLDADASRAAVAAALKTPMIDVKIQGGEARIYDACFSSDI
jgi:hypothetical protein